MGIAADMYVGMYRKFIYQVHETIGSHEKQK